MPNDTVLAGLRRELTRELFEELTALQCAPEEILGYVGTDERKLRRWCRRTYGRPLETMMDMIRMNTAPFARRLAAGDSYTFLMKELEKVDENILEPLSGTDWPRDMPVITGGGIIESIASVDVTYASTGGEDDNLFFEAANDIPVIQADMSKSVARTFNFAEYMSFSTMEREKMEQVGRDPETFLNKGIRLHCDKLIDRNVYQGFEKVNSTGLVNNPAIARISAATAAGGGTRWSQKTADEILNDINSAISALWKDNDCSSDALPNHILVPVEQFGALVTRKVSDDSERSILTYVLENNLSAQQGDLSLQVVFPRRQQPLRPHGGLHEPGGPHLLQPHPAPAPHEHGVRRNAHQDPVLRPVQ